VHVAVLKSGSSQRHLPTTAFVPTTTATLRPRPASTLSGDDCFSCRRLRRRCDHVQRPGSPATTAFSADDHCDVATPSTVHTVRRRLLLVPTTTAKLQSRPTSRLSGDNCFQCRRPLRRCDPVHRPSSPPLLLITGSYTAAFPQRLYSSVEVRQQWKGHYIHVLSTTMEGRPNRHQTSVAVNHLCRRPVMSDKQFIGC